jgi:hypothetical protein
MSTTVFKGAIKPGLVRATFKSDFSNLDPDLLMISYALIGGANPSEDHAVVAPGGSGSVSLTTAGTGVLEILVATKQASDSGRLEVTLDGAAPDADSIQNAVRWIYSVQP